MKGTKGKLILAVVIALLSVGLFASVSYADDSTVDVSTPDEFFLAVYTYGDLVDDDGQPLLDDDGNALVDEDGNPLQGITGLNTDVKTINITADLDMTDWGAFNVSGKSINLGKHKVYSSDNSFGVYGEDFTLENGTTANVSTYDEFAAALSDTGVTRINVTADIDMSEYQDAALINYKTIDLGGHTVKTGKETLILEGINYTIQNGTIDSNGASYALWIGDSFPTDNVLIKNVTTIGGINVYYAYNVVLEDVNDTAIEYYAVWCDGDCEVIIKSGTYTSDVRPVLGLNSASKGTAMSVEGGTFITNDKGLVLVENDKYNAPVITGGIYDTDPSDFVSKDSTFIKYVDSEGNVSYAAGADSIAELLADAGNGDTVTVLQGSSVTIPAGVTVINESGDKISVNGVSVDNNEQVVAEPSADLNKEPNTNPTTDKVAANASSDSSANTGDDFSLMVWVVLLILAGFGACTATKYASSKNDRM